MSTPRKIRCLVESVQDHGDHVYTFSLKPERSVPAFRPGQFLHLTVDEYDPSGFWPESRVFSIASSPQERDRLVISYSVKGVYTTRMEHELAPGKFVWVKLPYGDFVVDGTREVVLIAGGTGITAFRAFIEGLSPDHPNKVVLLYGARRPGLLLGLEMIERKRREVALFKAEYFSETGVGFGSCRAAACGAPQEAEGEQEKDGTPHAAALHGRTILPDPFILPGFVRLNVLDGCCAVSAPLYYLAGPPVMVSALRQDLAQRGVPDADIKVDAWE